MDPSHETAPVEPRRKGARWTVEQRGAAFKVFFSTGSRRKARRQVGVPERTLSVWLKDARYEDERRAVQAGLLAAVQQGAVQRGAEVVEATREAILVCRKALRQDPDGRTSSSLLSALNRARETEDRIQRLDEGGATEIRGVKLSDEDRAAFEEWRAERRAMQARTDAELAEDIKGLIPGIVRSLVEWKDVESRRVLVAELARDSGTLVCALSNDLSLALRLHAIAGEAVEVAQRQIACVVVPNGRDEADRDWTDA